MAYKQRLTLLHSYIHTTDAKSKTTKSSKRKPIAKSDDIQINTINSVSIIDMAKKAKTDYVDIVALMREHFTVEEICI